MPITVYDTIITFDENGYLSEFATVGIDRHRTVAFLEQRQPVYQRQKLADIICPLRHRPDTENLLSRLDVHTLYSQ